MVIESTTHIPQACVQNIGDAELSYLRYEGEGPPLIFLHATGFQPWLWHPLARELADDYQIIAPSLCDHRETDPDEGGLNWMTLAEDTVRLCDALRLDRPFLVGHSMGATVLLIANALCELPAAGMILIEPILLPPEFYRGAMRVDEHPLAAKAVKRTNFWRDRNDAMTYLHSRTLFQGWTEEMLELYILHGMTGGDNGGLRLACSPQREAALFMGGRQFDPWPLLPKVSCPVLIVEGEESDSKGFIDVARIQTLIPNSRRRTVKGAGHLVPMERPREVTRIIREFFHSLRRRKDEMDYAVSFRRDRLLKQPKEDVSMAIAKAAKKAKAPAKAAAKAKPAKKAVKAAAKAKPAKKAVKAVAKAKPAKKAPVKKAAAKAKPAKKAPAKKAAAKKPVKAKK